MKIAISRGLSKRISSSLKLALVFLVFGTAYVLFSDYLTLLLSGNDLESYNRWQNYKGILFIILSAGLIYWVSRKLNASIDRANRQQDEALKRYNVLGMATNDAVWDLNLITGECYTNRTLQEMFGYTADELNDNNTWWTNNLHPDDRDRVIDAIDSKLKSGGTVWQDEYMFRCKNGEYKTVFDRGFIMRDKDGSPYRLIGAMQDVTSQRLLHSQLTEEKLKHKNEMAQSAIRAQENERKKLGEELHDNINQLLGVVKLYVEQAIVDPTMKQELLQKSSEYLMQAIQEIGNLSKSLIPPTLSDIGLKESILELAHRIEKTKKMRIDIQIQKLNESKMSDLKKLMIYRIIQEQLNNVLKHSEASSVSISLTKENQLVKLTIHDNGRGFDPIKSRPGTGLNNIRNRLEAFNGSLRIHSAPGKGCSLDIAFEE